MTWRNWMWAATVLAGCNQVFGLEQTDLVEEPNDDRDGDGVLDQIDVCADIPDPLQVDTDGDGIGDLCDPCIAGSNHHEDGDGLEDGCDNCPQLDNVDQANDDGDDLGNVCDHDPGMQQRVLFDGFSELNDDWIHGIIAWAAMDDAVWPTMDTNIAADLWHLRKRVDGKSWFIEVGFTVAEVDGSYGIMGHSPTGAAEFSCMLNRYNNGTWQILAYSVVAPVAAVPPGVLTLRLRRSETMMHCEIDGLGNASTIDNLSTGTQPGVRSSAITKFTYLDAVSGP